MKRIKRVLAVLLVFVTAFIYTPFIADYADSYAGNGTDEDQFWIYHAVEGRHNMYYYAGTEISVSTEKLLHNEEYGYSAPADVLDTVAHDPSNVYVRIYYYQNTTDISSIEIGPDDATLDDEVIVATIPDDADENSGIIVEVYDWINGWYYRAPMTSCRSRNVDATDDGAFVNKGDITITLPAKGKELDNKALKNQKINLDALRNTMLISAYNDGIAVDGFGSQEIDVNKDGKTDIVIGEDWAPDLEQWIGTEGDAVDVGAKTKSISIKSGMPFGDVIGFGSADEFYKTPYYSKVTFKFPSRSIKSGKATLKSSSLEYTGKYLKPTISAVKVSGKTLKAGTDYTVSGSRKAIGPGKITITGKNKYTGTLTKTFTVKPGQVTIKNAAGGTKKLTVKWGKKDGDVKYQVKYRVKGTSTWKNAYTSNTYKSISNLKTGKTYQVKVRAYKKVNGKTYYGKFSAIKSITVK